METTESTAESTSDVFAKLMAMPQDPNTLAFIFGPVALLVIVAIIFAVFVFIKRRREEAFLKEAGRGDAPVGETEVPADEDEIEIGAVAEVPKDVAEVQAVDEHSWLERLRQGLSKTRAQLGGGLAELFGKGKSLDKATLEKVHEVLFRADVGVNTADHLVSVLEKQIPKDGSASWHDVKACLQKEIATLLEANEKPVNFPTDPPQVILIVGVNGVGKTTTIAKLTATFLAEGKNVLLAAADTFRAAAIDQLKVWGDRLGVDVIAQKPGSDPAAVAYDGLKAAMARGVDVLLIDTAGRLHSKKELMDELSKINRVLGKDLPGAPHETWLVVDATTGQNAIQQVKAFKEVVEVTGLVVTKLDGTAKGGVLVGASNQNQVPIRYVGIGEKASDLRVFNATDYAESLF